MFVIPYSVFCPWIIFRKNKKIQMKIEPKPYKLINHIQNYEWGTKGKDAFIPNLLGFEGDDKPYAELWIGGHPKLSSNIIIEDVKYNLKDVVKKYPIEILGEAIANKFGSKIPFLLKVLSASQALSIQTHPSKQEAVEFHRNDPKNYPDDNHKPEIAITLDSLSALVGFRPLDEIEKNICKYPQLLEFIGEEAVNKFLKNKTKRGLKNLFSELMNKSTETEKLKKKIQHLKNELENKVELSEDEQLFLTLYKQYGVDIGLLVLFFLNVVNLKPGEAIFTPAGIPHAYLKGNIIECMANSDNVVRAGLTNKFKDITQLTNILTYEYGKPELIGKELNKNIHEYSVAVDEFRVEEVTINNESLEFTTENRIEIILLTNGEVTCDAISITKGESLLLPALLNKYSISSNGKSTLFRVVVPK